MGPETSSHLNSWSRLTVPEISSTTSPDSQVGLFDRIAFFPFHSLPDSISQFSLISTSFTAVSCSGPIISWPVLKQGCCLVRAWLETVSLIYFVLPWKSFALCAISWCIKTRSVRHLSPFPPNYLSVVALASFPYSLVRGFLFCYTFKSQSAGHTSPER
jgi:hypothetical protein